MNGQCTDISHVPLYESTDFAISRARVERMRFPVRKVFNKHKGGFLNGNLSCFFGLKILVSTVGVISFQPMAAAEKLGKAQAICGVIVTGCREFEGSIEFRRDLDTESRYASFRDRNRVCLIGCDIRGIWDELSVCKCS
jgi:hypothetical protein